MSKKKKYVDGIIEDITTLTMQTIPSEAAAGKYQNIQAYINGPRTALNILLIEAMLGCEIKSDKVKFNHKLPSKSQISEICSILSSFINNVENRILLSMNSSGGQTTEQQGNLQDMGIPQFDLAINEQVHRVTLIDKVNEKKLRKEILDRNLMSICKIDVTDCLALAAMGEKARAKANRDKMLIIGGVAILLTGAAIAGVVIYNRHKDAEVLKVGDEVVDGDIPEIGDGDIPEITDMPQVDIDD